MGWGTYYKHAGYLSRISKDEINDKIEECDAIIGTVFRELLALAAATPPATAKDCEGEEYPWTEYIAAKMKEYQDTLEEEFSLRARLYDCKETMAEHPEDVTEG